MPGRHPKSKRVTSETVSRRHKTPKRNLTWLWIGLGALLVIVAGFLLLRPKAAPSVEITPAEAYAKYQQGAFFLDVRSQDEWNQFHIAGSTLIPLDELQNRLTALPKNRDIVVVCLSGHRSTTGVGILQESGFTRVFCLSGGLQAWKAANYPLEQGAP
jgi:rhodanese-related sulfurtransferase